MESISRGSSTSSSVMLSSILSIVAGALMLLSGLLALSMIGVWVQTDMPKLGMMAGGGMMGGGWGVGMTSFPSSMTVGTAIEVMSVVSAVIGAILIIGGYSIQKNPESAGSWGIAILVPFIVGFFGIGSGFFIGPILGIIGGILALTIKK